MQAWHVHVLCASLECAALQGILGITTPCFVAYAGDARACERDAGRCAHGRPGVVNSRGVTRASSSAHNLHNENDPGMYMAPRVHANPHSSTERGHFLAT